VADCQEIASRADEVRRVCRKGNEQINRKGQAMSSLQTATLGGGCFWCLDAVFRKIRGVVQVESGYCGGRTSDPTYEQICTGQTGHAEVVRAVFDADEISFAELLQIFFAIHDPTTLNRQGNDIGTQYRSVIFTMMNSSVSRLKRRLWRRVRCGMRRW
jgi:peptide-methionine (S)-S-oxide reductase